MTILYSCNSHYVNQTMISMDSVLKHHKEPISFLLVSDLLSASEKYRMQELVERAGNHIRFFELKDIPELKEMETDGVHPKSIYAKLFPERLTKSERLLYLDSDLIAMNSFSELFQMDLQGCVIAGVQMPYTGAVLRRQRIRGEVFLCDGMVLIDVKQWKKKRLSQKAMDYIHHYQGKPERMSESVINSICAKQMFVLPPKYNLMPQFLVFRSSELRQMYRIRSYYSSWELEEARKKPVLIHFMNELYNRPWCKRSKNPMWNHPYRECYVGYQRELGICQRENETLSVWTKMTRYAYKILPFPLFLWLFLMRHKE